MTIDTGIEYALRIRQASTAEEFSKCLDDCDRYYRRLCYEHGREHNKLKWTKLSVRDYLRQLGYILCCYQLNYTDFPVSKAYANVVECCEQDGFIIHSLTNIVDILGYKQKEKVSSIYTKEFKKMKGEYEKTANNN